jgi:hypothetical protein
VVGGLVEVVEHEVPEPQPAERADHISRRIEKRNRLPQVAKCREQVRHGLGAVGGGIEGDGGCMQHPIAPVVRLEEVRPGGVQ